MRVAAVTSASVPVTVELGTIDFKNVTDEQKAAIETKMRAEKGDEYVEKLKAGTLYDNSCPVDPFEKVMCGGCQ